MKPLASIPPQEMGSPASGKRVSVTEPEYAGTDVCHSLYLPANFGERARHPLIVEFTGNYFPASGSTGRIEDAHLGFSLTLGRDFIWVVLPFIATDHRHHERKWMGDENATMAYAKTCIPRIIEKYHGDPGHVILCGFSRGAIAAGYIGLHDDEIAKLWSAFFTFSHFDGVREWDTPWGKPLEKYRAGAVERLHRVQGRPWWIGQEFSTDEIAAFLKEAGLYGDNYTLDTVPMNDLFPTIPNDYFIAPHTDLWPLFDHVHSRRAREWIYRQGGIA